MQPPQWRKAATVLHRQPAGAEKLSWLRSPYESRSVSSADAGNTQRIYDLIRAGNIYLSLSDAIALAIENNLDAQVARYQVLIAGTDVVRAKGGGTLRGVGLGSFELPAGAGGPASPLITAAASGAPPATSVPTDIFDLTSLQNTSTTLSLDGAALSSPLPSAAGPPIPQYDPMLTGSLLWSQQSTPQQSTFTTGTNVLTTRSWMSNLGLQQGFSSGTQYSIGYSSTLENSNSMHNGYNPASTGSLSLSITQPLLRGFGSAVNRRWIRIAKNNEKLSNEVFRQDLMSVVYGVRRLYYDLESLTEDLRVKKETLASAQELYKNTQAGVEEGTLAQVELTRAQAQTAGAEQDVINADGLLQEEEALVKEVLTRNWARDPALQYARVIVTDVLSVPAKDEIPEFPDLLTQATNLRPDYAAADLEIQNSQISLEGTRNSLLPELDLIGTIQNQGLAGSPTTQSQSGAQSGTSSGQPGTSSMFSGGYGTSLGQLLSGRYPTYEAGIQLNLPLRNRVAQADSVRDHLQLRAYQTQKLQLQNRISVEIQTAMLALRRAHAAYDAAVRTRQLQEESLEVEKARYEAGVDTIFFVIQYQAYLSQARSTEVIAKGDYFKAVAGLDRTLGKSLEVNHISVDEAYQGRLSVKPSTPPVP